MVYLKTSWIHLSNVQQGKKKVVDNNNFCKKFILFCLFPIRSLDLSAYVPMSATPSPPQDRPSFVYDLFAVSVSTKSSFCRSRRHV